MLFQEVLFHALHQVIVVKVSQKAYWDHDVEVCSCLARQLLNLSVSVCCVGLAAAHGWILSLVPPALWGLSEYRQKGWGVCREWSHSLKHARSGTSSCCMFQRIQILKDDLIMSPLLSQIDIPGFGGFVLKKKKKKMFLEKMCLLPWHLQPELMGCTLDKMFIL